MEYGINIALGYLLGAITSGLVIGYIWLRRDIREIGSGKTGATNVLRTAGKLPAGVVLVADIGKGVIPAVIGRTVFDDQGVAAAGALAAIVGHVWPVFAGFRGGRGVATAFGGAVGLAPVLAIAFPLVAAIILATTRYVSLMSTVGTAVAGAVLVAAWLFFDEPGATALFAAGAVALIEFTHLPNIRRLLAGTEPRIGQGGDRPATG